MGKNQRQDAAATILIDYEHEHEKTSKKHSSIILLLSLQNDLGGIDSGGLII
jgi:hypothetical protein